MSKLAAVRIASASFLSRPEPTASGSATAQIAGGAEGTAKAHVPPCTLYRCVSAVTGTLIRTRWKTSSGHSIRKCLPTIDLSNVVKCKGRFLLWMSMQKVPFKCLSSPCFYSKTAAAISAQLRGSTSPMQNKKAFSTQSLTRFELLHTRQAEATSPARMSSCSSMSHLAEGILQLFGYPYGEWSLF